MAVVPNTHTFAGTVVTSSEDNTYIRDPLLFLLNRPFAVMRQTVAQTLANGTAAAITFDVHDYDSAAGHSTSINPSRYTAVYPGQYRVSGGPSFAVNAAGIRAAYWYVNGTIVNASEAMGPAAAAVFHATTARSLLVFLNVNDYVELFAYQTSGGALNTAVSAEHQSTMVVEWVSN